MDKSQEGVFEAPLEAEMEELFHGAGFAVGEESQPLVCGPTGEAGCLGEKGLSCWLLTPSPVLGVAEAVLCSVHMPALNTEPLVSAGLGRPNNLQVSCVCLSFKSFHLPLCPVSNFVASSFCFFKKACSSSSCFCLKSKDSCSCTFLRCFSSRS